MFTLSKGMYSEMAKKPEYFVSVLGLDDAGKTVRLSTVSIDDDYMFHTFAEQFKACVDRDYKCRHPSKISSTVGLNCKCKS